MDRLDGYILLTIIRYIDDKNGLWNIAKTCHTFNKMVRYYSLNKSLKYRQFVEKNNYSQFIKLSSKNTKNSPSSRKCHGSFIADNKFFIFGGINQYDKYNYDMFEFDLNNLKWREIYGIGQCPKSSSGYSYSKISKGLLLFGGYIGSLNHHSLITTDELYFWNHSTYKWYKILCSLVDDDQWPESRSYHAQVTLKNNKILIFGGLNETKLLNDLLIGEVIYQEDGNIKVKWREITARNQSLIPCPRFSHSIQMINENSVVLIGGFRSFDKEVLKDYWVYNIELNVWEEYKIQNIELFPTFKHGVKFVLIKNHYIVLYDEQNMCHACAHSSNRLKILPTSHEPCVHRNGIGVDLKKFDCCLERLDKKFFQRYTRYSPHINFYLINIQDTIRNNICKIINFIPGINTPEFCWLNSIEPYDNDLLMFGGMNRFNELSCNLYQIKVQLKF